MYVHSFRFLSWLGHQRESPVLYNRLCECVLSSVPVASAAFPDPCPISDLGPGTLCCSVCMETNTFWSNRIQRIVQARILAWVAIFSSRGYS